MPPRLPNRRIMAIIRGTTNNISHKLNHRWCTSSVLQSVKTTTVAVCAAPAVLEPWPRFAAAHVSFAKYL
ncbi:unnamed protein product [Rhizoctonia solani]|uniref:Uncharacterized protein n=1 Tax=Rhizoctonia solani TaxID=456999 RepID=A0A8H3CWL1_9AGAM|nr:unnamed protein product [Rhizoctonia solani]